MCDWDVGDLALCVRADPCVCGALFPCQVDRVYRVEIVAPGGFGQDSTYLLLEGVRSPPMHGDLLPCSFFRKVLPDEAEPCSAEFEELVRRRVDSPEPVDA